MKVRNFFAYLHCICILVNPSFAGKLPQKHIGQHPLLRQKNSTAHQCIGIKIIGGFALNHMKPWRQNHSLNLNNPRDDDFQSVPKQSLRNHQYRLKYGSKRKGSKKNSYFLNQYNPVGLDQQSRNYVIKPTSQKKQSKFNQNSQSALSSMAINVNERKNSLWNSIESKVANINIQDYSIFATYLFTMIAYSK